MRPEDRERAQIEAATRVVDRTVAAARSSLDLEAAISDTLYHERRRLERAKHDARFKADSAFYQKLQRRLRHASDADLRHLLDQISRRFAAEIVGNFDDNVYKLSTTVVPTGLSLLLGAMTPKSFTSLSSLRRGLSDHMRIEGAVDHVRSLLDHGTLIVVPARPVKLERRPLGNCPCQVVSPDRSIWLPLPSARTVTL